MVFESEKWINYQKVNSWVSDLVVYITTTMSVNPLLDKHTFISINPGTINLSVAKINCIFDGSLNFSFFTEPCAKPKLRHFQTIWQTDYWWSITRSWIHGTSGRGLNGTYVRSRYVPMLTKKRLPNHGYYLPDYLIMKVFGRGTNICDAVDFPNVIF